MNIFDTLPSIPTAIGPMVAASAATLSIVWLFRPRRASARRERRMRRRLGFPKGVLRWLVITAMTIIALLALGIDLEGLWSTMVAALSLIAIGFVAMWSILSHMLASLLLVVFRPFGVGDRIDVVGDDAVTGEVTDLNPVYTTLRTDDGGTLQVPNNLFFQKAVKRHPRAPSIVPHSTNAMERSAA